jgi:hypothetical protein
MNSAKTAQQAEESLNSVRFEWSDEGAEFGSEIVLALAGRRQEEKIHEPAA